MSSINKKDKTRRMSLHPTGIATSIVNKKESNEIKVYLLHTTYTV